MVTPCCQVTNPALHLSRLQLPHAAPAFEEDDLGLLGLALDFDRRRCRVPHDGGHQEERQRPQRPVTVGEGVGRGWRVDQLPQLGISGA